MKMNLSITFDGLSAIQAEKLVATARDFELKPIVEAVASGTINKGDAVVTITTTDAVEPLLDTTPPPPPVVEDDTPPPPPIDVELDINGLPWDARIHASTKTKLASGAWKYKQGIDRENLVPQVEAELKAVMQIPAGGVTEQDAPPAPVATNDTPPPPPADTSEVTTLPEIMAKITASGLDSEEIKAAANSIGIEQLPLLGARKDLIPALSAKIDEMIALKGLA